MAKARQEAEREALPPSAPPGQQLRAAREALGLSIQDVAAQLRLHPQVIGWLEENAFARLPASAYVRGYLRAYARLLKLEPQPLLAAYEAYAEGPPELLATVGSSPEPQARASDFPVRAVTYLIVFSLLALLGSWLWQTQKQVRLAALAEPEWGAEEGAAPRGAEPVLAPAPRPAPAVQGPAFTYPYEVVEHAQELAPSTAPEAVPAGREEAPPSAGSAQEGRPALAPVLAIELDGDSWVEVYDAQEERLYYDLGRKGARIEVQGSPPYRVLLGNAGAARVSLGGRSLDVAPFTREGVARFRVDAEGMPSRQ